MTWTPDSVTENPDGTYAIDYTTSGTVSVGDVVEVNVAKTGFDGSGKATA